jgi:hypothetical protein
MDICPVWDVCEKHRVQRCASGVSWVLDSEIIERKEAKLVRWENCQGDQVQSGALTLREVKTSKRSVLANNAATDEVTALVMPSACERANDHNMTETVGGARKARSF